MVTDAYTRDKTVYSLKYLTLNFAVSKKLGHAIFARAKCGNGRVICVRYRIAIQITLDPCGFRSSRCDLDPRYHSLGMHTTSSRVVEQTFVTRSVATRGHAPVLHGCCTLDTAANKHRAAATSQTIGTYLNCVKTLKLHDSSLFWYIWLVWNWNKIYSNWNLFAGVSPNV